MLKGKSINYLSNLLNERSQFQSLAFSHTHKDRFCPSLSHNPKFVVLRIEDYKTIKSWRFQVPLGIVVTYGRSENSINVCDNYELLLKNVKITRQSCYVVNEARLDKKVVAYFKHRR